MMMCSQPPAVHLLPITTAVFPPLVKTRGEGLDVWFTWRTISSELFWAGCSVQAHKAQRTTGEWVKPPLVQILCEG